MSAPTGYVTVSATNLCDSTGTKITNATASFTPVNNDGKPISYRAPGSGVTIRTPIYTPVVNGALSLALPNVSATLPQNVAFALVITDNISGDPLLSDGYGFLQPTADLDLDNYEPIYSAALVTIQPGPQGPPGTIGVTTTPADTSQYAALNPNALASQTSLNPGMTFYDGPADSFGMDLGYSDALEYYLRAYTSSAKNFAIASYPTGARPSSQSAYTKLRLWINDQGMKLFADADGNNAAYSFPADGTATFGTRPFLITSPVAPASTLGYLQLNPTNSASPTGLTSGVTLYDGNGAGFGVDLGYSPTLDFYTRVFSYGGKGVALVTSSKTTSPESQADFDVIPVFAKGNILSFFMNPSTGAAAASVDSSGNFTGNFTGARPVDVPTPVYDSLAGTDAVSQGVLRTELLARVGVPQRYTRPRTGMSLVTFGDSITFGSGATSPATAWPAITAANVGATLTNRGVGSDAVSDLCNHVFNFENANASSNVCYTVQIGTNDLLYGSGNQGFQSLSGAAAVTATNNHKPLFAAVLPAAVAWLGTRAENRVQGGTVAATNWSQDSATFAAVSCLASTTNGASVTYALTTYGKPIYLWYRVLDGYAGSFSVSVEGGATQAVSCAPASPVSTHNGATSTVQMLRIPVAAGSHNVVITVTSATGDSNLVSIVALGTPSPHTYYASPTVAVGTILPCCNNPSSIDVTNYELQASAFNDVILDVLTLLMGDGLDIVVARNRAAMRNGLTSLYVDGWVHPNDTGYAALAQEWTDALHLPPADSVLRGAPLSSAGPGTPGESWAFAGFVYGVQADGTIQRSATITW